MTKPTLQSVIAKLDPATLDVLDESEKALLFSKTLNLDDLIHDGIDREEGNQILLRITSLLTAEEVKDEAEWPLPLQALAHLEDKSLILAMKKVLRMPCYSTRSVKTKTEKVTQSPTVEKDDIPF